MKCKLFIMKGSINSSVAFQSLNYDLAFRGRYKEIIVLTGDYRGNIGFEL